MYILYIGVKGVWKSSTREKWILKYNKYYILFLKSIIYYIRKISFSNSNLDNCNKIWFGTRKGWTVDPGSRIILKEIYYTIMNITRNNINIDIINFYKFKNSNVLRDHIHPNINASIGIYIYIINYICDIIYIIHI